ncbi:MAG: sporulation protein YqfD [Paenibacillus sp. RIFOXYA1_FULL_44_5]|nr:MAG: sporulation protein YqfD [Paenibacillus sp. RIFOXYA1_FULL_44_5]
MRGNFFAYISGYVRVQVRGQHMEKLLNGMTDLQMKIWGITRKSSGYMELNIFIKDFFRLRPLLKQTGSRVHVIGRYGFPFVLEKMERRKFFAGGIILFLAALYILSNLVWHVEVQGNDQISTDSILQAAKEEGIYPFQWKFRLKDPSALSHELQSRLPETSWVGVQVEGTKVTIKVVESSIPDKKQLMNPRNLVAAKTAVVTEIFANKGRAVVKPNQFVHKGDILISGLIGDEQNQQIVVADGKVRGLVWEHASVTVPLVQKNKTYTGLEKNKYYVVVGNRAVQIWGYGKIPFSHYESIEDRSTLHFHKWPIPLGWIHETLMEDQLKQKQIAVGEAKAIGMKEARDSILRKSGNEAAIQEEKVISEKAENGMLKLEALFSVEQNIAAEAPIISQNLLPNQH